jgi:hypothetical protein
MYEVTFQLSNVLNEWECNLSKQLFNEVVRRIDALSGKFYISPRKYVAIVLSERWRKIDSEWLFNLQLC